jgi:hypothetical protein
MGENNTTAPGQPTSEDKLRAKLAGHTTPLLLQAYAQSARAFDANPQGPDSRTHIVLLGMLDMEMLKRDIPCCAECSVPDALNFHLVTLHTQDAATNAVADALTGAVVAAATGASTDDEDDEGFGQPDGLLGPTEAERAAAHDDEIARVRAMATDPGIIALAGAWKDER